MVASEFLVTDHQSVPSPTSFASMGAELVVQPELSLDSLTLSQSPSLPVDREIKEVIMSTEPPVRMKTFWDNPMAQSQVIGVQGMDRGGGNWGNEAATADKLAVRASWAGPSEGMGLAGLMISTAPEGKPMERRCIPYEALKQEGKTRSDIIMASRRAEEAACRRQHAMQWLQMMTGADLPLDPSEEDFRKVLKNGVLLCELINRLQPGSVPKIIQDPASPMDSTHAVFQSFENIRNFLTATEALGIPGFLASDLEQESPLVSGTTTRIVECMLGLKTLCEYRQQGGLRPMTTNGNPGWKYVPPGGGRSTNRGSPLSTPLASPLQRSRSSVRSNGTHGLKAGGGGLMRRSLIFQDMGGFSDLGNELRNEPTLYEDEWRETAHHHHHHHHHQQQQHMNSHGGGGENSVISAAVVTVTGNGLTAGASSVSRSMSVNGTSIETSSWEKIHGAGGLNGEEVSARLINITQTLRDQLAKQQVSTAVKESKGPISQLLSSMMKGDSCPEQVVRRVEHMMTTMLQEFDRRLLMKDEHMAKMRDTFMAMLKREDEHATENRIFEALALGPSDEIKNGYEEDRRRLTEELIRSEIERERYERTARDAMETLQRVKLEAEQHRRELEVGQLPLLLEKEKQIEELRRKQELQREVVINHRIAISDLRSMMVGTKAHVRNLEEEMLTGMQRAEGRIMEVAKMAEGYSRVLSENRRLYNEVQDLKGNIRVYCRVRPLLGSEVGRPTSIEYCGENGDIMVVHPGKTNSRRTFTFDKVFSMGTSQADVFMDTKPLIRSVLDGFNVCIFAYGQTGSGKTFTMSGPTNSKKEDWGVNYRALNDLFNLGITRQDTVRYEVAVQMLEIYNEQLRDLLSPDPSKKLEIRNNSQQNGLNVPDASLVSVKSTEDVLELMKIGLKNRAVGATALNERSSRSHSVLTVHVQGKELTRGGVIRGCLHLVDLAGSERLDRSEATGDRLKEAQHINKSLSALGDVIAALALKNNHVPFRNSKLTQLLQDSLGGQAKTLMFVHVSPDEESYGETVSTLKFAERVSSVELGQAKRNQESSELRELREMVANMKETVQRKDLEIERLANLAKDPATPPLRVTKGQGQTGHRKQNSGDSVMSRQEERSSAQQPQLERIPSARSRRPTVDPSTTAPTVTVKENVTESVPAPRLKASCTPSKSASDSDGAALDSATEPSELHQESESHEASLDPMPDPGSTSVNPESCSLGEPVKSASPPLQKVTFAAPRRRNRDMAGAVSLQLPRVQEASFEDWNDENERTDANELGAGAGAEATQAANAVANLGVSGNVSSASPVVNVMRSRSPGAYLKDPLKESNDEFRAPVYESSMMDGRKSPPPRSTRAMLMRDDIGTGGGKLYSKGFVTPPRSTRRPVSARASIDVTSGLDRSAIGGPSSSVRSSLQAGDTARGRNAGSRLPRPHVAPDSGAASQTSSSSSLLPRPPSLTRTASRTTSGASPSTTPPSGSSTPSFIPVPQRAAAVRRSVQGLAGLSSARAGSNRAAAAAVAAAAAAAEGGVGGGGTRGARRLSVSSSKSSEDDFSGTSGLVESKCDTLDGALSESDRSTSSERSLSRASTGVTSRCSSASSSPASSRRWM